MNFCYMTEPDNIDVSAVSERDRAALARRDKFVRSGTSYAFEQATRPPLWASCSPPVLWLSSRGWHLRCQLWIFIYIFLGSGKNSSTGQTRIRQWPQSSSPCLFIGSLKRLQCRFTLTDRLQYVLAKCLPPYTHVISVRGGVTRSHSNALH
jgi:hypothetical protein